MSGKFKWKVSQDEDTAYLKFPRENKNKDLVKSQIKLQDYINTGSAEIFIDYDENGNIYGIEILL
ncbi:DUF2283 domain-containing protein [Ignatzschineria sp. LJL83]